MIFLYTWVKYGQHIFACVCVCVCNNVQMQFTVSVIQLICSVTGWAL